MGYRGCWTLRMSRLHCGFFFLFPPSQFLCAIRHSCCGTKNENQSLKMIWIGTHQDNNLFWRWLLVFAFYSVSIWMSFMLKTDLAVKIRATNQLCYSHFFGFYLTSLLNHCLLNLIKIAAYFNLSMPKNVFWAMRLLPQSFSGGGLYSN